MPLQVLLTATEAELLAGLEVNGIIGRLFSYDPMDTMTLLQTINAQGGEGAERLTIRLADLYARHIGPMDTAAWKARRKLEEAPSPTEDDTEVQVPDSAP